MRKTILTILGSALLASSMVQLAAAAQPHRGHKADRAPATLSEPVRNSNAAWPATDTTDGARYYGGGYSAPAGR